MKHILKFNESADINILESDETFTKIIEMIKKIIDNDDFSNGEKLSEIGELTNHLRLSKSYFEEIINYFGVNDNFYNRWLTPILDDYKKEEEENNIDKNISKWFKSIDVYDKIGALKKLDDLGYKIVKK